MKDPAETIVDRAFQAKEQLGYSLPEALGDTVGLFLYEVGAVLYERNIKLTSEESTFFHKQLVPHMNDFFKEGHIPRKHENYFLQNSIPE